MIYEQIAIILFNDLLDLDFSLFLFSLPVQYVNNPSNKINSPPPYIQIYLKVLDRSFKVSNNSIVLNYP